MGIFLSSERFASWCNIVAFSQNVLFATTAFTWHVGWWNSFGNCCAAKELISYVSDGNHDAKGPISNNTCDLKYWSGNELG